MNREQELRKEFLKGIKEYVNYWRDIKLTEQDDAVGYRLNGLAFSILVMIDGNSSLNDFKHYTLEYGGVKLNNEFGYELHSDYGMVVENE